MVWGGLGVLGGSWGALGKHVGGNLAPRVGVTDFWRPPGRPQGPILGPSWGHVAAKLGHFGVILEIKWAFLGCFNLEGSYHRFLNDFGDGAGWAEVNKTL